MPPPALLSPLAGPPPAEEPPRPSPQRPPAGERTVEPVREEAPTPRPRVTAESASVIGPLMRRRRTATLFGLRRR
jgi:hypothetical protein